MRLRHSIAFSIGIALVLVVPSVANAVGDSNDEKLKESQYTEVFKGKGDYVYTRYPTFSPEPGVTCQVVSFKAEEAGALSCWADPGR